LLKNLGYSAGNGHRMIERLYERPIMSVSEERDQTGTSYPAANQLVDRLVKIGILEKMTDQARHCRFQYDA
jgi:DNA-binding MarR family transcriptional regulator